MPPRPRHPRQLGRPSRGRSSAWWSVATQKATSKLAVGERQPLTVGLDPQVVADALPRRSRRARARSPGRRRGRRRRTRSRAAGDAGRPSSCRPRSRARGRPGARSRSSRSWKPTLGRAPGAVLPAEVAVQERQRRIDAIVGLVPALLARELGPGLELAQLRREPGRLRVEQPWDPGLRGVATSAGEAAEIGVERAAAARTDDERGDGHRRDDSRGLRRLSASCGSTSSCG